MKLFRQSEASECGLACLAMIADHYGYGCSLQDLRKRFLVSLKGLNLTQISKQASMLGLIARPLRIEMDDLWRLSRPCILHWNLAHFVVLKNVSRSLSGKTRVVILDPALGERILTLAQVAKSFTGVALELSPGDDFEKRPGPRKLKISDFTGKVHGIKKALLQVLMVAVVLETLTMLTPIFGQLVIDDVIPTENNGLLNKLGMGFIVLLITQTAFGAARSWMLTSWSVDVGVQWSARVKRHLLRLPLSFFEKRHIGDIVSKFGSTAAIQSTLTSAAVGGALDGLMAAISLVMMLAYSTALSLVTIACMAVYILLRWLFFRPLRDASQRRLDASAKENSFFLESMRGIMPIKLFGRENERMTTWLNFRCDVANCDAQSQRLAASFQLLSSFISGLRNILILYMGAMLVIGHELTIGMMTAFLVYSTTFSGRIMAIVDMVVGLRMLGLHLERLADIVMEHTEPDIDPNQAIPEVAPKIELRDIRFRYSDSDPWILDGVNFTINPGQTIAISGVSGSGKTTLCKVMLGLLAPTSGQILVDDQPVNEVGLRNFRTMVGTVMQDDILIAGSILENIVFYSETFNEQRLEYCARVAAIYEDIIKMPMKFQTLVGDMGSALSGGQKQRVLLARALYRQPKILALDEATSHLDIATEKSVNTGLCDLQLTKIIIAHRPETLRLADCVLTLSAGRVSVGADMPDILKFR